MRKIIFLFFFLMTGLLFNSGTRAEYGSSATTPSVKKSSETATLEATLKNPDQKAQKKSATVEVVVTGVVLVDPDKVGEQVKDGQGHLHYQLDGGPVIATTSPKLSFHGLASGQHKIVVSLAANNHTPLGPETTLTVTVP